MSYNLILGMGLRPSFLLWGGGDGILTFEQPLNFPVSSLAVSF